MILNANLFKFIILLILAERNFACTVEERYTEIDTGTQQNVAKTRTVCCKGYIRNKEEHNKVICYPECKNCIQGYCLETNKCICNDGYSGENCNKRCDSDKWGRNCTGICKCLNGAQCDHITGLCICATGWIGKWCETRSEKYLKQRINAENWVQVHNRNGTVEMNAQNDDKILTAINSTLANITENIEKLHKKVDETKTKMIVNEHLVVTANPVIASAKVDMPVDYSQNIDDNVIEPSSQTEAKDSDMNTDESLLTEVYPHILMGISIILIVLTVILTIKIRDSINTIKKIQNSPDDLYRKKMENQQQKPQTNPDTERYVERPTTLSINQPTTSSRPVPSQKPTKPKSKLGQLPDIPSTPSNNKTIYDKVNERPQIIPESSYVEIKNQTSPIKENPEKSFLHNKARPPYMNFGIKLPMLFSKKIEEAPPSPQEEIYSSVTQDEIDEPQYETLPMYSNDK